MAIRTIKAHERGKGGKRHGAGRPPDWMREKCQRIIDKKKLIEFLARVADGSETTVCITKDGEVLDVACAMHDRLRATEILLDRAYGKASQPMEHSGSLTLEKLLAGTWDSVAP